MVRGSDYVSADGKAIWNYDSTIEHRSLLGKPEYRRVMVGARRTIAGGMFYVHSGYAGRQTGNPNDLSRWDGNVLTVFSADYK